MSVVNTALIVVAFAMVYMSVLVQVGAADLDDSDIIFKVTEDQWVPRARTTCKVLAEKAMNTCKTTLEQAEKGTLAEYAPLSDYCCLQRNLRGKPPRGCECGKNKPPLSQASACCELLLEMSITLCRCSILANINNAAPKELVKFVDSFNSNERIRKRCGIVYFTKKECTTLVTTHDTPEAPPPKCSDVNMLGCVEIDV